MKFVDKHTTLLGVIGSLKVQLIKIGGWLVICSILVVLVSSCTSNGEAEIAGDRLVAKVFNKSLFQSELDELIGDNVSTEDSTQIVNAYIEKWTRESVLMHEAEKYVPNDLNIDALVRDYRASLIRHNYEQLLVEMNLDSTINNAELEAHYQKYKEQYKLKEPILQCHFIKVPKTAEDWEEAESWWKSDDDEDYKKLVDYCSRYAEVYMLNDSVWYNLENVSQYLPKGKLTSSNYASTKKINTDDEEYEYLLKIFDTTAAGDYAPLAFVMDQATKVILHKRKISILEQKKKEMYDREVQSNNVSVYSE